MGFLTPNKVEHVRKGAMYGKLICIDYYKNLLRTSRPHVHIGSQISFIDYEYFSHNEIINGRY
jgi:hypothetical protein